MADTTLLAPAIPEQLVHRIADTTIEIANFLKALDDHLREADRLYTTVEVLANCDDPEWSEWAERSGLSDLDDVIHAVQSRATSFTGSMPGPLGPGQAVELAEMVRERARARHSLLPLHPRPLCV